MKSDFKYLKPIERSNLRIALGKKYFMIKRLFHWIKNSSQYSRTFNRIRLKHRIYLHKTPILRELKDVDMWLQYNKLENLKVAIKELDGLLIKPDEIFSYWKCIGKPTKRKGYKKGMVLEQGKIKHGIGGGLCQLSNLLFWSFLHTPLTLKERYRHGFDVFPDTNRKLPFGSGATCVYNYRDLQFLNETEETYQLMLNIIDDYLVIEICSDDKKYLNFSIYENYHKIEHMYWGGYVRHNEVRRNIFDLNDNLIDDQYLFENHALMMYDPLITSK